MDNLSIEQLLNDGFSFQLDRIYTGRFSKEKTRTFIIKPIVLAVLAQLSDEYSKLDIDESKILEDARLEAKNLTRKHAFRCCRIIALAVAGNSPFRGIYANLLTIYFFNRIDASMLAQLTGLVHHLANYTDFVSALRYSSAARTTKPQIKEEQPEETQEEEVEL